MKKKEFHNDFTFSYRRSSSLGIVKLLSNEFEKMNHTTWYDGKLSFGKYKGEILNWISHTNTFLPVLSKGCFDQSRMNSEDVFRQEIAHAIKEGCQIVPILIDDFKMPDKNDLPSDISEVTEFEGIEYNSKNKSPSYEEEIVNKIITKLTAPKAYKYNLKLFHLILIAIIIAISWLFMMPSTNESKAKKVVQEAREYSEGQDWTNALKYCSQALKLDTKNKDAINLLDEVKNNAPHNNPDIDYGFAELYWEGRGVKKDRVKAAILYREAAMAGHVKAMTHYGYCFYLGEGVNRDEGEFYNWNLKAAELGDAGAMRRIGCCYLDGVGVKKDHLKAVSWLQRAVDKKDAAAMLSLGELYERGVGVEMNVDKSKQLYQEAVSILKDASGRDDSNSFSRLGGCFYYGMGIPIDDEKAFKWYKKAAETDSGGYSALMVGECYANGLGVKKDFKKALGWYEKAAEEKNADAMYRVGLSYLDRSAFNQPNHPDLGVVKKDNKKAVEWFRKSIEQGDDDALFMLGWCYKNGCGVEKNDKKAFELFSQAAAKDIPLAMVVLGGMYKEGIGTQKSDAEAIMWYKAAMDAGFLEAANLLANYYTWDEVDLSKAMELYTNLEKSLDTSHLLFPAILSAKSYLYREMGDEKKAMEYLIKAADFGNDLSQFQMGLRYAAGDGVPQNAYKAKELYEAAAKKEFPPAKTKLGQCYMVGFGTAQNEEKAFNLYKEAFELEDVEGQTYLGLCYVDGVGTDQDFPRGFSLILDAGENGDLYAMDILIESYENGIGVPKNRDKAKRWMQLKDKELERLDAADKRVGNRKKQDSSISNKRSRLHWLPFVK